MGYIYSKTVFFPGVGAHACDFSIWKWRQVQDHPSLHHELRSQPGLHLTLLENNNKKLKKGLTKWHS